MTEYTAWADVPSVVDVLRAMPWAETACMYLERMPQTWLDEVARQQGVRCQRYDAATPFDTWERGRVFDAQQELKWERYPVGFHAVYCGVQPPAGWTGVDLHTEQRRDCTYYLWGTRVPDADRALLGVAPEAPVFVELQIPRLLVYPVPLQQRRVQIRIAEFYAANGQLCYARWCGIE